MMASVFDRFRKKPVDEDELMKRFAADTNAVRIQLAPLASETPKPLPLLADGATQEKPGRKRPPAPSTPQERKALERKAARSKDQRAADKARRKDENDVRREQYSIKISKNETTYADRIQGLSGLSKVEFVLAAIAALERELDANKK